MPIETDIVFVWMTQIVVVDGDWRSDKKKLILACSFEISERIRYADNRKIIAIFK